MRNNLPVLLVPVCITIFACNNSSKNDETSAEKRDSSIPAVTVTSPTDNSKMSKDSIAKITVDDFPVTDKMLECYAPNANCEFRYKGLVSVGKKWFTNTTLDHTLVVAFYTDYFREAIYLFLNKDIPAGLISQMSLTNTEWEEAGEKLKQQYFKGLLSFAQKTGAEYFTSTKGFKLGDPKEKALQVYGTPDKSKTTEGVEECEWDFTGDEAYDGKTDLKGKPLAKDNYGHHVIMFFRNNKLIGLVLSNDIP